MERWLNLIFSTFFVLFQEDPIEETGWKLVHGDVFRPPRYPKLFASLIGSGTQIFCCTFIVIGKLRWSWKDFYMLLVFVGIFDHVKRFFLMFVIVVMYIIKATYQIKTTSIFKCSETCFWESQGNTSYSRYILGDMYHGKTKKKLCYRRKY